MRILIKFADVETERKALGKLIPRLSGKSWSTGETAVPAQALSFLAEQGIQFTVLGPAPYEYACADTKSWCRQCSTSKFPKL